MTRFALPIPRSFGIAISFCVACVISQFDLRQAGADDSAVETSWHEDVLRARGIESDTTSLLRYLQQSRPDVNVDRLIRQLGSDRFAERRKATRQLIQIGDSARQKLIEAANGTDREIVQRARTILKSLANNAQSDVRESLLLSILSLLEQRQAAAAVEPLIDFLPLCSKRYLSDLACEAVWASANQTHRDLLKQRLASSDPTVQAAAIVAIEIVEGKDSVPRLMGLADSKDERIRLAVARALINHRPRDVLKSLVNLLRSTDAETRRQAAQLLRLLTGAHFGVGESAADSDAVRRWAEWAQGKAESAPLKVPVGRRRLDIGQFGRMFHESFSTDAATVIGGYRRFSYGSSVAANGSVETSMLRLDGQHPEGDQRLYISAERLIARRELPSQLMIETTMGGEAAGAGAGHVGVSIGNVRVLFHPGYSSGGFRLERVDNHEYLIPNTNIGFTPAFGKLYHQTIRVRSVNPATVRIQVTLKDPQDKKKRFTRSIDVPQKTIGPLNRIGLERSGRTGGTAIFGSILIRVLEEDHAVTD